MKIAVLDFESTGLPAENRPAAVIEAACYIVHDDGSGAEILPGGWQTFVAATVPVDVEARAVHHITDAEIAGGVPVEHAMLALTGFKPDYFCAHNAAFEQQFFTGGKVPWLDTYKIALRLWPGSPSHSNQVLRYWLGLDLPHDLAMPPHRALPDCYTKAHILLRQLASGVDLQQLSRWSAEPPLLVRVGFGKHRGKLWSEVDSGYLQWCMGQEMDAGVKHTARHYLNLRNRKPAA